MSQGLVYAASQEQLGIEKTTLQGTLQQSGLGIRGHRLQAHAFQMSDSGRHLHSSQEAMGPLGFTARSTTLMNITPPSAFSSFFIPSPHCLTLASWDYLPKKTLAPRPLSWTLLSGELKLKQ